MSLYHADLHDLLQCARKALRNAKSGHGAALVERICVTGSLGRGTYAASCEATGLVLFLNVDLHFSPHEVAKALDTLATSISSGPEFSNRNFQIVELKVTDAECRGGLWACLHARRRCNELESAVTGASLGRGDGGGDQPQPTPAPAAAEATTGSDALLVLQLFLAENMTSSVSARSAPKADGCDNSEGPLGLNPADEQKACQQQQNLMVAAEQRLRREARYRMRHSRAGAAAAASSPGGVAGAPVPAAAWAAKAACGVAEARRVFWSRQPEAARRAAREVHDIWRRAVNMVGKQQKVNGGGGGSGGGLAELWSDEVMLLLDVLAIYGYRQLKGQRGEGQQPDSRAGETPTEEPPSLAAAAAAAGDGEVVARVFKILSTDYANGEGGGSICGGMRVALQGGVLSGEEESGAADAVAGAEGASGTGNGGLVVLDPCFPVLNIYAAACEVVACGEGAGAGQKQLRQLAETARGLVGA